MRLRVIIAGLAAMLCFSHANAELTTERKEELHHMVLHDCGSCHGMTMKGGLGPALTPEALQDRTPETLAATVKYGRPGTPMPPFESLLSVDEINWIIKLLLEQ